MEASKQLEESRYLATITSLSAHNEYEELYRLPLATPVVVLKRTDRTNLKPNEHVIYAKSRGSAWARALKTARKIGTRNMGVHKDHAIEIIQKFNHYD